MKQDKNRSLNLGSWMTLGTPSIAELASKFDFDWLLFDLEHGMILPEDILPNLYAIQNSGIRMIVRVPTDDKGLIARLLDWGVDGIMLPHVSEADKAARCIQHLNYPPKGDRGFSGSARVYSYGLSKPENASTVGQPYFIVQIEDLDGVMNIDKIAHLEDVDTLFVGPSDLKLNLSAIKTSMTYEEAVKKVGQAARKYNKQAGVLIRDVSEMDMYSGYGFTCFAIDSDMGILKAGYQSIMKRIKNETGTA